MENINGKYQPLLMLLCATVGLTVSISLCFAQGNREAQLVTAAPEITTPFKCDSLDPKVCFDIYRRRMEHRPEGILYNEYPLGKELAGHLVDWPIDPLKDWNTATDVRGKSRGLIDPPKGSNPEVWLKNWVTIPKDSPIRP